MLRSRLPRKANATKPNRRGSAMIIAMGFSVVIGFAIASTLLYTTHQARTTARRQLVDHSILASQNAVETMTSNVVFIVNQRPPQLEGSIAAINEFVTNIKAPNMPGVEIVESYVTDWPGADNSELTFRTIDDPDDYWYGYGTSRLDYQVVALARENSPTASRFDFPGTAMRRRVTVDYIPMWAYWALTGSPTHPFELHPGPAMTLRGRIHSNADMRLAANDRLNVYGEITSVGRFIGTAGENTFRNGDVYIASASQLATERANPGTVAAASLAGLKGKSSRAHPHNASGGTINLLDSLDPEWVSRAASNFGGTIKDAAFGVNAVNPPLPEGTDPYTMLQRVGGSDSDEVKAIKFENNAALKIYGDPTQARTTWTAKDANGNTVPLSYKVGTTTKWIVQQGSFKDYRQLVGTTTNPKTVYTIDIDMANMIEWATVGKHPTTGATINFQFETGVIYASTNNNNDAATASNLNAIRIINGTKIPNSVGGKGMTLATDRPIYTAGNLNTSEKKTFMIAADAVTVCSKVFDINQARNAAATGNTTTNMVLLFGTIPTTGTPGNYASYIGAAGMSGGLHNSMIYLEDWAGKQHHHNGSLLVLFSSQVAKGKHTATNAYYAPPNRFYNWDSSLINQEPPPGMPTFIFVQMGDWEQMSPEDVAGYDS